jgi:predicted dienelactone hydrolase
MRNLLAALALIAVTAPAAADETLTTDTGLTYSQWLPADFATHTGDVPLIIFSHGFGGCAEQSKTLTQALADAGYAVLAPNHKDKACEKYIAGLLGGIFALITGGGPEKSFGAPQRWDAATESSRRDDVEGLLDFALGHEPYKHAIDNKRIAVMGHSLGGYTALGVAGGWPAWSDSRFKAALVMAPFASPYVVHDTLGNITMPVMYMAGTSDSLISADDVTHAYQMTKARKYLVVLEGAGHFSYTELSKDYQRTIAAYAIGFFDRELRQKPAPLLERDTGAQVHAYQHQDKPAARTPS